MKIFSDFQGMGYNKYMCQHVYKYTGPGLCGYCGLETNDPNWDNINKGYSEYREKVGFFYNTNLWWTIQSDYGNIYICTYQVWKLARTVEKNNTLCDLATSVLK